MRKLMAGLVGAAALLASSQASATVTITFTGTSAVPGNNDFQSELSNLGLTLLTNTGATIILDTDALLSFEFLGAESGFNDTFTAGAGPGSVSLTETANQNLFASPILFGTHFFSAGSLEDLLRFSSNLGLGSTVGDDGFGIFLGANDVSGLTTNVFYLGYDDQITNVDDDYDDYIVRVTVLPAVPEPTTWGMMLVGFSGVFLALRRSRRSELSIRQVA